MVEYTEEEIIAQIKEIAKNNCKLCTGRRILRSVDKERENSRNAIRKLRDLFNSRFNLLRKEDAETHEIKIALENKRICMDALEQCDKCDKEIDKINRAVSKLH